MSNINIGDPVQNSQNIGGQGLIQTVTQGNWGGSYNAFLFIFNPRLESRQFVRPYVYNFSDNLLDDLVANQFNGSKMFSSQRKPESVLNAILPTAGNGIYEVRNNEIRSFYTFILVILRRETINSLDPFLKAPSPEATQIISGYFLDEPYTSSVNLGGKPVMNMNATMVFTHDTTIRSTPGSMVRQNMSFVNTNHNADNISRTAEQLVVKNFGNNYDNRLFLMRPMDLNRAADLTVNFGREGVSGLSNASLNSVAGSRGGVAAVPVAAALKAPMQQLTHICEAAHHSIFSSLYDSCNINSFTNPFVPNQDDPLNMRRHYDEMFNSDLESVDLSPLTREGTDLDTSVPITLDMLDKRYRVLVTPLHVAKQDAVLTPQDEITTHKALMSSLIANSIGALLPSLNLEDIDFSYYSFVPNNFGLSQDGVWVIHDGHCMVAHYDGNGLNTNLQYAIAKFQDYMKCNIFPVLKNAGGDFELHCRILSCNESMINLIFLDEKQMGASPTGYWETNNAFNCFNNPLLAGEEIASANIAALAKFKDAAHASIAPVNQPTF